MSAAGWGTAVTVWLGLASGPVAVLVRLAGKRQWVGYCVFTGVILFFPVNLWFWQFGLTERGVPGWYIFSAVIQVIAAMVVLVLSCFVKFRPVVTALVMGYVFSLVLQLFSYLYWAHGTASEFSVSVSLSHLDSFYFALGTLTTAGTGNISPIDETTRGLQALQMGLDFLLIGFIVVLILTRYSNLLDRPRAESDRVDAIAEAVVRALMARVAENRAKGERARGEQPAPEATQPDQESSRVNPGGADGQDEEGNQAT